MTQGLEGIVAASTRLSHVDGEAGQLGAPPCNGPLSAPTAPVIAEMTSERVETMTLTAKVEALRP